MSIVLICLAIIMFLPIVLALGSIRFRTAQFGSPDIQMPRVQGDQLTGAGHRIIAAQANAWEALGLLLASLMVGHLAGLSLEAVVMPLLLFVAARLAHAASYLMGLGVLRFVCFLVSVAALIWILVLSFIAL